MSTQETKPAHPGRTLFRFLCAILGVLCILTTIGLMVYGVVSGLAEGMVGAFLGFFVWGILAGGVVAVVGGVFLRIAGLTGSAQKN